MAFDNDALMTDLQRVGVLLRHNRCMHAHAHLHREGEGEGAPELPEGHPPVHGHGHGHAHGHGHGHAHGRCHHGHKHHRDSGRHGQNRILAALVMQDGTSQKDLAYVLGIRPQSLTQALETLEKEGFVERRQDEEDKRANRVFLTEAGRGRAGKVAEDRRGYAEQVFSMLSDEEKEQLSAILAKINNALEAQMKEAATGAGKGSAQ